MIVLTADVNYFVRACAWRARFTESCLSKIKYIKIRVFQRTLERTFSTFHVLHVNFCEYIQVQCEFLERDCEIEFHSITCFPSHTAKRLFVLKCSRY